MPRFISTRGHGPISFADALFRGLAEDGGLYVPEVVPRLPVGGPARGGGTPTFAQSAGWACEVMLGGAALGDAAGVRSLEPGNLRSVVTSALDFDAPLVEVEEGIYVLELFHGPTLAFKDVGARFMARTMWALDSGNGAPGSHEADRTVLVATSGDTGGAVASAFHGIAGTRVVVLFPKEGISARQRRQMTTLGGNVTAVAVEGTFDDCQRMAKSAFADAPLVHACRLTSANSINVGRLVPQAFYYIHAVASLGWDSPPPTFVVPSGNLGNLSAGLLAQRAGMPAAGFVAASNANRVFPDYLERGHFMPRASVSTVSNAMDVGSPSNLERIRWLYGDDAEALGQDVIGFSVDDAETRTTIADTYRRTGYVLDPHSAVAYRAAQRARESGAHPALTGVHAGGPIVVLATAHPAKFPEVVEDATAQAIDLPEALAHRMTETEHWTDIGPSSAELSHLLTSEDAS